MTTFNPETDCIVLVDGLHGVHLPAIFCGHYMADLEAQGLGACARDVLDADRAPDMYGEKAERASEAWDEILDRATLEISGERWTLYQDQDLWAIREGAELPAEW